MIQLHLCLSRTPISSSALTRRRGDVFIIRTFVNNIHFHPPGDGKTEPTSTEASPTSARIREKVDAQISREDVKKQFLMVMLPAAEVVADQRLSRVEVLNRRIRHIRMENFRNDPSYGAKANTSYMLQPGGTPGKEDEDDVAQAGGAVVQSPGRQSSAPALGGAAGALQSPVSGTNAGGDHDHTPAGGGNAGAAHQGGNAVARPPARPPPTTARPPPQAHTAPKGMTEEAFQAALKTMRENQPYMNDMDRGERYHCATIAIAQGEAASTQLLEPEALIFMNYFLDETVYGNLPQLFTLFHDESVTLKQPGQTLSTMKPVQDPDKILHQNEYEHMSWPAFLLFLREFGVVPGLTTVEEAKFQYFSAETFLIGGLMENGLSALDKVALKKYGYAKGDVTPSHRGSDAGSVGAEGGSQAGGTPQVTPRADSKAGSR